MKNHFLCITYHQGNANPTGNETLLHMFRMTKFQNIDETRPVYTGKEVEQWKLFHSSIVRIQNSPVRLEKNSVFFFFFTKLNKFLLHNASVLLVSLYSN
jgi:hypothetical protein